MSTNELVLSKVKAHFPDVVEQVLTFRDELTLVVPQAQLPALCRFLRDDPDLQYNFLSDICADDMLPQSPRFAVNYHLRSLPNRHLLRLRTLVEDPDNGPETLAALWPIATWLETEVWDLMGITFKGNNSLRRLFLPEDWVGHPLRKDYPLGYEEVQFSFNWEAVDARKPYARD